MDASSRRPDVAVDEYDLLARQLLEHVPRMRRVASFIAGESDADDIVADIVARLLDRFINEGWRPDNLGGYLRTVASRRAVAHVVEARREGALLQRLLDRALLADLTSDTHEHSEVMAAVHELPLAEARAVLLIEGYGYTYRDAAQLLNTSQATLHERVVRAKRRLRVLLGETEGVGDVGKR